MKKLLLLGCILTTTVATTHTAERTDLPPEILAKIFSELDCHSIASAARVCKQWNEVTKIPALEQIQENDLVKELEQLEQANMYIQRNQKYNTGSTALEKAINEGETELIKPIIKLLKNLPNKPTAFHLLKTAIKSNHPELALIIAKETQDMLSHSHQFKTVEKNLGICSKSVYGDSFITHIFSPMLSAPKTTKRPFPFFHNMKEYESLEKALHVIKRLIKTFELEHDLAMMYKEIASDAVSKNQPWKVKAFIDAFNVDINTIICIQNMNLLMIATRNKTTDFAQYLINECGANPHFSPAQDSCTALSIAQANDNAALIELFSTRS